MIKGVDQLLEFINQFKLHSVEQPVVNFVFLSFILIKNGALDMAI